MRPLRVVSWSSMPRRAAVAAALSLALVVGLLPASQGVPARVGLVDQPRSAGGGWPGQPEAVAPNQAATPVEYAHDAAGRLVGVTDPAGETARYDYDEAGNLLQIERFASAELSVLSVVPARAAVGATVRITGTGFAAAASENTVEFGPASAPVTESSATELAVEVPAGAGNGPVTVTTAAGTATSRESFVVERATPQPEITGFSPGIGAPGTTVTITGTGFDPDPAHNVVLFEQTRAQVSAATATGLTVEVPEAAGTGPVTVKTPGGLGTSTERFVVPPPGYAASEIGEVVTVTAGGATIPLDLDAGMVGLVSFTGTAGQRLGLGFTGASFPDGYEVGAFTPTGKSFARDQFDEPTAFVGDGSVAMPPLPSGGTYQVVVDPTGADAGAVDVTLSTAVTGALDPVAGTGITLARPGQHAELSWTAAAGQRLTMWVDGRTFPAATELAMTVFDPYGAVLADYLVPDGSSFDFVTSTAGEHRVRVAAADASQGSGTVRIAEPGDAQPVTVDGDPVPVAISPGALTELEFIATAGEHVDFGFTGWGLGVGALVRARVIGPDGRAVLDQMFRNRDSLAASVEASGTHRLLLAGQDGAAGDVTVTASSRLDAGVLALNTPVTVGTSRPGQSLALRFAGEAGQRTSLYLESSSFFAPVRVRVLDPDGEVLTTVGSLSQRPLPPLPATGEYAFVVDGYSTTGSAVLRLAPAVDAGPISTDGPSVRFTLNQPGMVGAARFTAAAGQQLSFGFTGSTFGSADRLRMTVLLPDGVAVPAGDWLVGIDSAVDIRATVGGEYTLVVAAPQAVAGAVSVTLSDQQDLGVLAAGSPQPVSVDRPGQSMRFQFEGVAGQGVTFEFADFAFGFLLRLTVTGPDGRQVASHSAAALQRLPELPATGTYQVVASPYASTGTATLMLWHHTDSELVIDGAAASMAVDAGEAFIVGFDAQVGQRVGFGFSGWSLPASALLRVAVLTPDGLVYTASNLLLPQFATIELTIATTGRHRLFVAAADNVSTGSLTATVSTELDAGTLAVGGSRTLTFDRPGRPIRLHLDGTAGAQRQLAFSNFTVMFLPNVTVFRPDGSVLTRDPAALTMNFTLPVTGTYDVVVTSYTSTGSLTATLSAGTPTATAEQAPAEVSEGAVPVPVTGAPRRTGSDTAIPAAEPVPESAAVPAARDVGRPGIEPTRPMREPRRAPDGITAISGEIRTVDDEPLPGVTVRIGHRRTGTDRNGQFLLIGVPVGQQTLVVDGTGAGADDVSYGSYDVGVRVVAGQTTVLPQVSWLTPLDTEHAVAFDSPTAELVVLTHPDVPGLEVHIPAGTTVRDRAGQLVTELGITPIRVDRPPFPLPGFPVPVYFTGQPGGVSLSGTGAQIVYPNYTGAPAGMPADFWHYAPDGRAWYRYGYGHVTADGTQVVPERYVRLRQLTGAMINDPAQPLPPPQAPPPGGNATGGDPVDLATGLMVEQHTDLWLDDVLPVGVSRTYRQGDIGSHAFGVGTTLDEFGLRLFSMRQWEDAALVLPDGGRVEFTRITPGIDTFEDAVFAAEPTPTRFQGSILAWNGNGWDLRLRDGLTYVFGDEAPLQSIRDPYGNTVTITRAPGVPVFGVVRANGPITQITSPSGKWVRFAYDAENRITQAEDNLGRTVEYAYHDEGALEGHLARVTDPAGGVTEYGYETYQEDGFTRARLATITDPRGITYLENEYDAAGRVAVQTQTDGTTYEFAYTETGGRISRTVLTDPRGVQRRVDFDADGYAVEDTAAVGTAQEQPLAIERDPATHRPVATVDALGRRTEIAYDANGNPSTVTRLAGTGQAQTYGFAHDGPRDQLTQVTDPLGNVTTLSYSDDGALAAITDPVGRTTTFDNDSAGRLTAVTDALDHATEFAYEAGDLVSVTDPLGRTTRLVADAVGRVAAVTDPAGNTTRYEYDALNQTRSVTDPLGHLTSLDYDPNGNLTTVTDPRGNSTDYTYDDMDRVATRTDPLGRVDTFGYDDDGNLTEVVSRRGNRTEYAYDPLERLTQARYGVTSGGEESRVDYSHDAGNRLVGVDDSASGVLGFAFDGLDRLMEATSPTGTVSYGYDDADRRTSMTVAGQNPVAYTYNTAGDLLTVTQGGQQVSHSYGAAGRVEAIDLPGGWTQGYSYDAADQLTGIVYRHAGTVVGDLGYGYDAAGWRDRLSGAWARAILPDPFGPASYDAANQLSSVDGITHTYDADGNLTSDGDAAYGYNARNELANLTATGHSATFTYDGLGRRASAIIDGVARGYLYDGNNPVQERDAAGLPTANLLTGGLDVYYARTTTAGSDTYLTDVLGSTLALGAADGTLPAEYSYGPFGTTTVAGDDHGNRHQYTGRENDGTGLYHYRNRYYSPGLQRFIAEDPLGFAGGDTNLYAYAANHPVDYVDPDGLKPKRAAAKPPPATGAASDTVYRVIRPDENPTQGLFAKNPGATYTPTYHVRSGSRPGYQGQYISTTRELPVAQKWAQGTGNRIVAIDLSRVQSNVIDLSTEAGRLAHLTNPVARNYARSSVEVLIERYVPPEAVGLVK